MPKRIQRRRTKGWKMPAGAVYVGRPTKWGNPWIFGAWDEVSGQNIEPGQAVNLFRSAVMQVGFDELRKRIVEDLRGKDLCCWCSLDKPCHADVLLEIANR